jgi:hypothetical protein
LAFFYFFENFVLPKRTPIFLGFLAPPSKNGHFEVLGLGTESTIFGGLGGQKMVIFGGQSFGVNFGTF